MENMKEYIIKVVPLETAKKAITEREKQEQQERENKYQMYLNFICSGLQERLKDGYCIAEYECFRKSNSDVSTLFLDSTLCMKALNAVADAYREEGYDVYVWEHGPYYKKVGSITVFVNV